MFINAENPLLPEASGAFPAFLPCVSEPVTALACGDGLLFSMLMAVLQFQADLPQGLHGRKLVHLFLFLALL